MQSSPLLRVLTQAGLQVPFLSLGLTHRKKKDTKKGKRTRENDDCGLGIVFSKSKLIVGF
jgi:hypothetical protein